MDIQFSALFFFSSPKLLPVCPYDIQVSVLCASQRNLRRPLFPKTCHGVVRRTTLGLPSKAPPGNCKYTRMSGLHAYSTAYSFSTKSVLPIKLFQVLTTYRPIWYIIIPAIRIHSAQIITHKSKGETSTGVGYSRVEPEKQITKRNPGQKKRKER